MIPISHKPAARDPEREEEETPGRRLQGVALAGDQTDECAHPPRTFAPCQARYSVPFSGVADPLFRGAIKPLVHMPTKSKDPSK